VEKPQAKERQARLAEALRANLKRRKAKKREAAAPQSGSAPDSPAGPLKIPDRMR